jgi:TolB-like protein/Flp pilus assembly protein TadD
VGVALCSINLIGPFRLCAPDGTRIDVVSKKGQALLAMLAMAGGGERTRSWLQGQLWGSRLPEQAQASLRSELSTLRIALSKAGQNFLHSDKNRVWLDLTQLSVDAREDQTAAFPKGAFLEGLDIVGEEGFEEWLREERARCAERVSRSPQEQAASPETAPIAASDFASLPALAILPFTNMTGDVEQDFLAEGISEDLIDRMARSRWLPVIARSSSFALREENPDLRAAGKALGARYVLEGRLRRLGTRQSLNVSLGDSENGQLLWSHKYDFSSDSAPEAFDALLVGLTTVLGARIEQEEQARAMRKPQSDLNVRDLIWKGRWHLNKMTKKDSALAKSCFAQALAQEPNSPEALIQSIWAKLWEIWAERRSDEETRALRHLAQKAIIADLDDARGHMLAGIAEIWLRQPYRAETLLRHAISLNPSLALAYAELGSILYLKGEPDEAIAQLNVALRLSPNDYTLFYTLGELAMAHLMVGQYDQAVEMADGAILRRSGYWYSHVVKINALVRGGKQAEAHIAWQELQSSKSNFEESQIGWLPFIDGKWTTFLTEGLNLAAG